MNICKDCKHTRRGRGIDRRHVDPGEPAPPPRPGLECGNYICGAHPIIAAPVDPQTGFQAQPSGEDCRDLNPFGECSDFVRAGLLARFFR